jgi:hypothetical protein
MITISDINYLLDLFKEIEEGVDDGVRDEIDNARDLLNGLKRQICLSKEPTDMDRIREEDV